MLLASYGFGIRLKPQMDKGNFILRPTFSLALLARVSALSGGNNAALADVGGEFLVPVLPPPILVEDIGQRDTPNRPKLAHRVANRQQA